MRLDTIRFSPQAFLAGEGFLLFKTLNYYDKNI